MEKKDRNDSEDTKEEQNKSNGLNYSKNKNDIHINNIYKVNQRKFLSNKLGLILNLFNHNKKKKKKKKKKSIRKF